MALIQDYKDVIKLAYQSEVYWTKSKQLMTKGHHWYNLDIPVATPRGIEFCLAPDTKVLTSDLRWVPVGSLKVDDTLLAFDEYPQAPCKKRKWRTSIVESIKPIKRPSYKITLENGEEILASAEHQWLVYKNSSKTALEWVKTQDLRPSFTYLMKLVDTWTYPNYDIQSYEKGYLAGVFDGEGWIQQTKKANGGHGARVGFAQRDNALADTTKEYLANLGFRATETRSGNASCSQYHITGRRYEFLRFLGTVRPKRLLDKFNPNLLGEVHVQEQVKVSKIEYVGEKYVTALATSTKTVIAQGYASHNSAPPTAPSIVNDAADHLAGNWPEYAVKTLRETQTAEKDQERLQISLNHTYDILAREYGKALHRTLSIHGGWSGMMAARIYLHDGWDMDNPTVDDLSWMPLDPRYVYPDPGTLGKEFVIYRQRRTVGSIRQSWPDWEGQWYSPAGWGAWNTGPESRPKLNERVPDTMVVDFIEYWDDRVKCFVSNGYPVFREVYGQDVIPHGLGINPVIVRSAGYGDDTGEPHERFRSMLYYIFPMLESEAKIWTQYKWIVEDTAWPTIIAHDSMRPLDLTPASVNYVSDLNTIKEGIRTIRDDAVEPKALTDILSWLQGVIERATYPTILKGQAPNGIRAGYPIAILSTQAKLKFASPSDALKSMMEELAYKTLAIIQNRIDVPVEIVDNYKINPDDFKKYRGRISCRLDPNLPTDVAANIPKLELAVGSFGLPKEVGLKELGYEDPLELRDLRLAEDLADDPMVRQVMAQHFLKYLAPEYSQALEQENQVNVQMQDLQQKVQLLQGKIQEMGSQMQLQQATAQPAAPPAAPVAPTPPAQPPGPWGGQRPGAGGSVSPGQNPGNPNQIGQSMQENNPMTALAAIAREMRAVRSIDDLSTQEQAYGAPTPSL